MALSRSFRVSSCTEEGRIFFAWVNFAGVMSLPPALPLFKLPFINGLYVFDGLWSFSGGGGGGGGGATDFGDVCCFGECCRKRKKTRVNLRFIRIRKWACRITCSGIGGGGGKSLSAFICWAICIFKLFKLFIWLFSWAMTSAFGSSGAFVFGFNCGDPDRDVLWLRANIFAATDAFPLVIWCIWWADIGGDIVSSGTGGGGGKASRPADILRLRVGVFALDPVGVLPVLGGAGGGCVGRILFRDGEYKLSFDSGPWPVAAPYRFWALYTPSSYIDCWCCWCCCCWWWWWWAVAYCDCWCVGDVGAYPSTPSDW